MPRKGEIIHVGPPKTERRRYSRLKGPKVEEFKEVIKDGLAQGRSQRDLQAELATKGLKLTESQLKYRKGVCGLSRRYRKRQHSEPSAAPPMLTPPPDDLESSSSTPSSTTDEDTSDTSVQQSPIPEHTDGLFEILQDLLSSSRLSSEILCEPENNSKQEPATSESINQCPLSQRYAAHFNQYIERRKRTALYVDALILEDCKKSGYQYNYMDCYNWLQINWKSKKTHWWEENGDYECWLLPPDIYAMFWQEDPASDPYNQSPEGRKEFRRLKEIFERIIPVLLDFDAHRDNSTLRHDFRSVAAHILTIEKRFGMNHIFMVEAINTAGGLLNQVEDGNTEDVIALSQIELGILIRLGLTASYSTAHCLAHWKRGLEVSGDIPRAAEVERCYQMVRAKINHPGINWQGPFHPTIGTISSAQNLLFMGKSELGVADLGRFLEVLKNGKVVDFSVSHGHVNIAFDYRSLAIAFLRTECLIPERLFSSYCLPKAAECFELAIQHFRKTYYPEKRYQTMRDLARVYIKLGKYEVAAEYYMEHFRYRMMYGKNDPSALCSLRAMESLLFMAQERGWDTFGNLFLPVRNIVSRAKRSEDLSDLVPNTSFDPQRLEV